MLAQIREVTGDIEGAIDAVNAGYTGLRPGQNQDRVMLLARSGILHYLAGRLDIAERVLHEALAVAPADEAALDALARVKIARGQRAEALEIFSELARSSGNPRYLYQAAEAGGGSGAYGAFERAASPMLPRPTMPTVSWRCSTPVEVSVAEKRWRSRGVRRSGATTS